MQPQDPRVEQLLGRMTLEEKVGQLNQLPARANSVEQIRELARAGILGSRILASTAHAGNEQQRVASVQESNDVQRIAVEQSRLGIPLINGRDIIHGHRTVFPIPLAQAAAWDPALVEQASEAAAGEASGDAVHWTFAPMVDIARDARWGRIAEGYGEDPHLASVLAAAAVRGFQGADPSRPRRLLACAKHYVGYGAAEGGRDYNTAEITDGTLRNVYLPPFAAAIKAGVASILSGFHCIGGECCTSSRRLLTTILRDELGFDGFVVSDWDAVAELVQHGAAADRAQAAELSLAAGVDLDMVSGAYAEHMAALVRNGRVSIDLIDRSVRRMLAAKVRAGLFDRPYTDPTDSASSGPRHRELARRAAASSIVLLKNRGVLPLSRTLKRIAVIGPMAEEQQSLLGTWTLDGVPADVVSIAEGIRRAAPKAEVRTCGHLADVMQLHAASADAIVLCLGENSARSGEDNCIATLELPPGQEALISAMAEFGKPLIVVICGGRPLSVPLADRLADAVLFAWHGGIEAGNGLADVLFGEVDPIGRLPVSVPRSVGQVPVHYNHGATGRPWSRKYLDMPATPLYPFGFGLSYASFEFSQLRIAPDRIGPDQKATVTVKVTNTSGRAGQTVVQCYIRGSISPLIRPVRELKAFTRLALGPGESRQVRFELGPAELGSHGPDGRFTVDPGRVGVWVGGDCRAPLAGELHVRA